MPVLQCAYRKTYLSLLAHGDFMVPSHFRASVPACVPCEGRPWNSQELASVSPTSDAKITLCETTRHRDVVRAESSGLRAKAFGDICLSGKPPTIRLRSSRGSTSDQAVTNIRFNRSLIPHWIASWSCKFDKKSAGANQALGQQDMHVPGRGASLTR